MSDVSLHFPDTTFRMKSSAPLYSNNRSQRWAWWTGPAIIMGRCIISNNNLWILIALTARAPEECRNRIRPGPFWLTLIRIQVNISNLLQRSSIYITTYFAAYENIPKEMRHLPPPTPPRKTNSWQTMDF